ncbi:MAG: hypothetical protein KY462_09420 [Actinobacteria bacterium]|nr:hypothetical protein [Actinomycetota bacterium]
MPRCAWSVPAWWAIGIAVVGVAVLGVLLSVDRAEPIFTRDSYWNTPLEADAPVHPASDDMIDFLRRTNVDDGCVHLVGVDGDPWGEPVYHARPADPEHEVRPTRYELPPEFARLRIPEAARPSANSDAEMVVFDRDRGYVAWFWHARYDRHNDRWSAGGGSIAYLASNGLDGRLPASDVPRNTGSHRGLNGAIVAVRYQEVASGSIDRVLKVAVRESGSGHVFPMVGSDGDSDDPAAPPQGTRIRIAPDIDLDRLDLSPQARVIARALQDYGAVIGDSTGGPIALKLEDAPGRDEPWELGVRDLCDIPIDAFQVVKPPG